MCNNVISLFLLYKLYIMSNYNPKPTRVWSRVQNPCTYDNSYNNQNDVYTPLTGQIVSLSQANYEQQMINKGNILQYKGNSARLTKSQKYSQLVRCAGPNRTKVFATQSQTYTNPNTSCLLRVNYKTYEYPNQIPGVPNNISGPFQYNEVNPNGCPGNTIQDGGALICGTQIDPCTNKIIKQKDYSVFIYNPASASDVPGGEILGWSNKIQTWFPRNRYVMNNSTDKWPINYKDLKLAIELQNPFIILNDQSNDNTLQINWLIEENMCFPITRVDISINGELYKSVNNRISSIKIAKSLLNYDSIISVQSFSNNINSPIGYVKYTQTNFNSTTCSCSDYDVIMKHNSILEISSHLTDYNNTLLDLNSTNYNFLLGSYNELKLELERFKKTLDKNCCFTKIIDVFQKLLTQLYQSSTIKNLLLNQTQMTLEYKDAYDTLNDPNRLSNYIEGFKNDYKVIKFETTSQFADLKPQYYIYFQRYGIPENLNFDSEKLLDITDAIAEYNNLYGVPEYSSYNLNIINNLIFLKNNPTIKEVLLENDESVIKELLLIENTYLLEEKLTPPDNSETNDVFFIKSNNLF
jgi:hypothetical protein